MPQTLQNKIPKIFMDMYNTFTESMFKNIKWMRLHKKESLKNIFKFKKIIMANILYHQSAVIRWMKKLLWQKNITYNAFFYEIGVLNATGILWSTLWNMNVTKCSNKNENNGEQKTIIKTHSIVEKVALSTNEITIYTKQFNFKNSTFKGLRKK